MHTHRCYANARFCLFICIFIAICNKILQYFVYSWTCVIAVIRSCIMRHTAASRRIHKCFFPGDIGSGGRGVWERGTNR